MKLKMFSIAIVAILTLMGCQMNDEGARDKDNDNIEQTRYNEDNPDNRMNENRDGANNGMNENQNRRNGTNNEMTDDKREMNDNDKYDVSKEAAEKITSDVDEIENAYVLTTKNNAYVAAVMDKDRNNDANDKEGNNRQLSNPGNTGEEVTDDVKKKITDIVQTVDDDIDNVYVTTNPDFADLTNDYTNEMNEGKPVRGFFDQIGNMIERVFPNR